MKKYYVTKDPGGDGEHEVHDEFCRHLPGIGKRYFLGEYPSCLEAVEAASEHYERVNSCILCSPACRPLYFR